MSNLNFFKAAAAATDLTNIINAGGTAAAPVTFDNVNLIDDSHVSNFIA